MELDEIKNYLRIDYEDEDKYLQTLLEETEIYIQSCVGTTYKTNKAAIKLANLLQKKLISDIYENRSTFVESKYNRDIIVSTILDKLSMCEV